MSKLSSGSCVAAMLVYAYLFIVNHAPMLWLSRVMIHDSLLFFGTYCAHSNDRKCYECRFKTVQHSLHFKCKRFVTVSVVSQCYVMTCPRDNPGSACGKMRICRPADLRMLIRVKCGLIMRIFRCGFTGKMRTRLRIFYVLFFCRGRPTAYD